MGLLGWFKEPGTRGRLIRQMYSDDPKEARAAVDDARRRGYLTDLSMRGVDLSEANLPDADLSDADLKDVILKLANLSNANLKEANLAESNLERATLDGASLVDADLKMAVLNHASLKGADLSGADLGEAELSQADLTGATLKGALLDDANFYKATVTEKQLQQAQTMAGVTMPEGELYDGRFNLPGDLIDAKDAGADLADSNDMGRFYGVAPEFYEEGQAWASKNLKAKADKPKRSTQARAAAKKEDAEEDDDGWIMFNKLSPSAYIDLLERPFHDREALEADLSDWDNAKAARNMAGWLAATLLWLPIATGYVYAIVRQGLQPGPLDFPYGSVTYLIGLIVTLIVFIGGGWALTAFSFRSARNTGVVKRILAMILALLAISAGTVVSGLAFIAGAVIAITLAYYYASLSARTTVSAVGAFLLAGPLGRLVLSSLPLDVATSVRELPPGQMVALGLGVCGAYIGSFLLSFLILFGVRLLIRNWLLKEIGMRRQGVTLREFVIAYGVLLIVHIWEIIAPASVPWLSNFAG